MSDDDSAGLIAQLQARLDALEAANIEGNGDAITIQRDMVALHKARKLAERKRLEADNRHAMARSGWYHPDGDVPSDKFKPFPTFVHYTDKNGEKKSAIANNQHEKNVILGLAAPAAQAVTVDIAALARPASMPKRGRPPKAKTVEVELPKNIE